MGLIEDYVRANILAGEEGNFNDRFIAFLARNYVIDGSPEGVIAAPPGAAAWNINGGDGTTLYVKESGVGDTGWVGYGGLGASTAADLPFTPEDDITSTNTQDAIVEVNAKTGIMRPIDDLEVGFQFIEDFITRNTVADGIGSLSWVGTEANGGVISAGTTNAVGGWVKLATGTGSSGGLATIALGSANGMSGLVQTWVGRVYRGGASAAQAYRAEFGLFDPTDLVNPVLGAYFRINADANPEEIQAVTCDGTTENVTNTGVMWQHLTTKRFKVTHDGAGSWRFYVDGVLVATHSTNVPNSINPLALVLSFFQILKTAGTTTSRFIEVDYAAVRVEVAR